MIIQKCISGHVQRITCLKGLITGRRISNINVVPIRVILILPTFYIVNVAFFIHVM